MLTSVSLQRLRGVVRGDITDLGGLAILLGPNGSGKSTILDALHIGAAQRPAEALYEVIVRRAGLSNPARWLFHGSSEDAVIRVKATDAARTFELKRHSFKASQEVSAVELLDPDTSAKFLVERRELARIGGAFSRSSAPRAGVAQFSYEGVSSPLSAGEATVVVEPSRRDAGLAKAFNETQEAGFEAVKRVVELVAKVHPGLRAIQPSAVERDQEFTPLSLMFDAIGLPLEACGDGTQAFVRLCFYLASARGRTVLLEEPDAHQHPRTLGLAAEAILGAIRANTQVVLSTHSLDLVDHLLARANERELAKDLRIHRCSLGADGTLSVKTHTGIEAGAARAEFQEDLR